MEFTKLHPWDLTPKEAIALQKQLAEQVPLVNALVEPIKTVAGVDVSYKKWGNIFHAAVVVLDYQTMEIVDTATASGEVAFPYVPGLLSFRELPILLAAMQERRDTNLLNIPSVLVNNNAAAVWLAAVLGARSGVGRATGLAFDVRRDDPDRPPVLYVHALHFTDVASLRRDILRLERLAVRAFGTKEQRAELDRVVSSWSDGGAP